MHGSGSREEYLIDDDDYDEDKNDNDDFSCNSVNFQVRTSRFCKEVDLDKNFDMIISIRYRKYVKMYDNLY